MPRSSTRQATFPLFSRSIPQRRPARPANPVRDSPYSFEIPASRLNQLSPPVRRNNGFSEQLISDPSFHFIFSPPVSWTYCEPSCGTGDQGIDQESAYDNAVVDVREAGNGQVLAYA
ncbi:hypothetical protein L596_004131 [Steinernema carpocapsae]|uniref:Uncharacterized protein n=1 Tax=Steinernema carpocapsae TaxID=34508 RepID=A0A4V6I809_STECR|nr:hypothetical protein L596_004131 [Steinernema carpocapsae]